MTFGPGIGVAGNPGDPSARWVDGLLLLGATVRFVPALAPMAMRRQRSRNRSHGVTAASSPAVRTRMAAQRRNYRNGALPAAYSGRADAAEPQTQRQGHRAVGTPIAYL